MDSSSGGWQEALRRKALRGCIRSLSAGMTAITLIIGAATASTVPPPRIPPLPVNILNPAQQIVGKAEIYPNFIVLRDGSDVRKGTIGAVQVEGRLRLFLIRSDTERSLVGWAEHQRLYNAQGKLLGYYHWTPIWSYVYDTSMRKLGQAQCLAYQGVCAAGVAGYLLGLL